MADETELRQQALDRDIRHLVGRSRAFVMELEGYLNDIGLAHDERAARVVEALGLTLAEPARPGTLRDVEEAASALLRELTALVEVVRPK